MPECSEQGCCTSADAHWWRDRYRLQLAEAVSWVYVPLSQGLARSDSEQSVLLVELLRKYNGFASAPIFYVFDVWMRVRHKVGMRFNVCERKLIKSQTRLVLWKQRPKGKCTSAQETWLKPTMFQLILIAGTIPVSHASIALDHLSLPTLLSVALLLVTCLLSFLILFLALSIFAHVFLDVR